MTSNYFFVSIKLCLDVGNEEYVILCYCGGCFMSGFAINNNNHHHKTFSIIITINYYYCYYSIFFSMLILLIVGFTYPLTMHFKVITKCDNFYYKVRQLIYYRVRQVVLQSATILLQSATEHGSTTLLQHKLHCERFEPRSHFKSRLSLIVRVNVVLNRTVVVDND